MKISLKVMIKIRKYTNYRKRTRIGEDRSVQTSKTKIKKLLVKPISQPTTSCT